ncbi:LPXTG cell wall anchor domain-containing protein, partial [Streptomyces peucetius]|uniref:LPXTG cell wall anchor domain-containing protein n=1 Tax=Streptomyces peucetius TaxID=1950 RepID=UPI0021F71CDE
DRSRGYGVPESVGDERMAQMNCPGTLPPGVKPGEPSWQREKLSHGLEGGGWMTTHRHRKDRKSAGGLLCGAFVCVMLTAGTGDRAPALLASGLLISALMLYRRTVEPRPYAYWPAWMTGSVIALLLAWASTGTQRLLLLPLAAIEAAAALVLFLLWRRRRDGRGDWIVWNPNERKVLRREWTRRDAVGWAEFYGRSCAVSRIDWFPELATEVPLYPDRHRPGQLMPHLGPLAE